MTSKDLFKNIKGRRSYQLLLDEETGEITDITSRDDFVQVIRCKDCKHFYEKKLVVFTTCWYQSIVNAQPNDFCSRAERKEE